LEHAEDFGLRLVVVEAGHADEFDAALVDPVLEVVSLRLVHYQHHAVVHSRELLVREARRVHLELGLADVRLILSVIVASGEA